MRFSDAPFLSLFSNGAKLRSLATNVQSRAEMAVDRGDVTIGAKLVAFWTNQIALLDVPNGHPTDGEYLGIGYDDMRKACYKVTSELRMYEAVDKRAELVAFLTFFKNAGTALAPVEPEPPVEEPETEPAGKNGIV